MAAAVVEAPYVACRDALLLEHNSSPRLRRAALQAALLGILREYTDMTESDSSYCIRRILDYTLPFASAISASELAGEIADAIGEVVRTSYM